MAELAARVGFVVASNMLGSSFGSTNAGSINPQTGEA